MNTRAWYKIVRIESEIDKLRAQVKILFWINAALEIPLLIALLMLILGR